MILAFKEKGTTGRADGPVLTEASKSPSLSIKLGLSEQKVAVVEWDFNTLIFINFASPTHLAAHEKRTTLAVA